VAVEPQPAEEERIEALPCGPQGRAGAQMVAQAPCFVGLGPGETVLHREAPVADPPAPFLLAVERVSAVRERGFRAEPQPAIPAGEHGNIAGRKRGLRRGIRIVLREGQAAAQAGEGIGLEVLDAGVDTGVLAALPFAPDTAGKSRLGAAARLREGGYV